MKPMLIFMLGLISSSAMALGVCGADCEFARFLNPSNGGPVGGSYGRLMTSGDLKTRTYAENLIDLKTCKGLADQVDAKTGNGRVANVYSGSGTKAFAYLMSWKSLERVELPEELYTKLKKEFKANRKFCYGSYNISDDWSSEASNFVYSMDGEFLFAEIFGVGP